MFKHSARVYFVCIAVSIFDPSFWIVTLKVLSAVTALYPWKVDIAQLATQREKAHDDLIRL